MARKPDAVATSRVKMKQALLLTVLYQSSFLAC
jgi:hypothetical protein